MKSIFFLTRFVPPQICGVGDYSFNLVNCLSDENITFGIICESTSYNLIGCSSGVSVYPVVVNWNWMMIFDLFKFLKKNRPSEICIQYVPHNFSFYGIPFYLLFVCIFLRLNHIKSYIFFHEVRVRISFFRYGFFRSFVGLTQQFIALSLCILSKPIGTTTNLYQKFLRPFNVPVLPVFSNFGCLNFTPSFTPAYLNNDDFRIVIFSSRLTISVLKELSFLYQKGFKFSLHFIGFVNSEKRHSLEFLAASFFPRNVFHFYNNFNSVFISKMICSATIVIHHENLDKFCKGGISSKSGLVVSCFAFARCIFASYGDMTDANYFVKGSNFIDVDFTKKYDLFNKLEFFILHPKRILEVGLSAHETYMKYFSIDIISSSYLNSFKK